MNDHGLGDTIQFCRYLPLMVAAGVEPTFLCPPRLHRLLATLGIRLVAERPPGERFDAQIAVSSLPRAFATRLDSVPAAVPYLSPSRIARRWAARIGGEGFRIGVVWQGNPNPEADMARSFPLAALAPLAASPACGLISLQIGSGRRTARRSAARHAGRNARRRLRRRARRLPRFGVAMARARPRRHCDTSIAHLAGALARRSGWRWSGRQNGVAARPCRFAVVPTLRLFRQAKHDPWGDIFTAWRTVLGASVPMRRAEAATPFPAPWAN